MMAAMRTLIVLVGLIFLAKAQEQQDPVTYFGGTDNDAYLEWLSSASYSRTDFLPSPSGNSTGAALHWTIRDDQIFLAVAAKATAWLGFGIGESGGMFGSDVVIYTASTDSLMDGHILDERLVFPDDCQNWKLLNSTNDGGFLIFEAVRLLDTGDSQDHPIMQDGEPGSVPSRVIAAWSDSTATLNHGPNNRAATSLHFHGTGENNFEAVMAQEAEGSIEMHKLDYPIKEADTEYAYTCFSYADLIAQGMPADTPLHAIGLEPIIDPRGEKYVHHFILYGTTEDVTITNCDETFFFEVAYAWAPGEGPQSLPSNVGAPLGEDGFKAFRLETHYNNPWLDSGIIDSSGVRVHYTSQKREHDLGMLQLGDPAVRLANTPVGPAKHVFDCPSSCSKATLTQTVTVLRESLHMHQKGLTMSNDHFRDGQVIRRADVSYYDFSQQGAYAVQQEPFEIQPGDSFKTTCEYLDSDTVFGGSSQEEMCMVFIAYYPRQTRSLFGLEVPFVCGYDLPIPDCSSDWEESALESAEDLTRTFGAPSDSCDAVVGGTTDSSTSTSGASRNWLCVPGIVAVVMTLTSSTLGIL